MLPYPFPWEKHVMNAYRVMLKIDGAVVEEMLETISPARLERYDLANRAFALAHARNEIEQLVELDWELLPRPLNA